MSSTGRIRAFGFFLWEKRQNKKSWPQSEHWDEILSALHADWDYFSPSSALSEVSGCCTWVEQGGGSFTAVATGEPRVPSAGGKHPRKNNPWTVQTVFSGLPPAARLGALGGLGGLFGGFGSVVQTPCPSLNLILGVSCGHGRFLDQCSLGSKGSAAPLLQAGLWGAGRATAWVLAASREFISSFLFFRSSSGTLQTCAGDGVW